MKVQTVVSAAALCAHQAAAQFAQAAMMRFQCSQLVIERLDPLVNPGLIGSPHMHQIVGGNSFNASMTPVEYDPSERSTCTTCSFSEDFSNYWTANMYFRAKNGSYKRVPQMVNLGLSGEGGVTVYYIPSCKYPQKHSSFSRVFFFLFFFSFFATAPNTSYGSSGYSNQMGMTLKKIHGLLDVDLLS